jgi:tape measure domain-containing protein
MQDINIKISAEVKEFLDATKAAKDSLGNIKTTNDQMKESLSASFDNAAKDSGKLAQQAAVVNKLLGEQEKQLSDLIKYQQVLKKAQDATNDPTKARQYKDEIKNVDTEIKRLSSSLSGLGEKNQFISKTGLLLAAGITAIATAAISAGKACIQAAAATEQYRISFQTLTGSLAEGNKLFDDLIKLAANTPFELPQLQEAAKSLTAFGFSSGETIKTLTSLGDISAGVGQDKLPQLVAALGKVKATSKLTGEALQSFSDAGVPLLQVLADKGGVSVRQIQKDISAGKVSFEETQAAIQSMSESGGKFFGLMEKQSKSLAGQWSNLKDGIGQLASDLGSILLPALSAILKQVNNSIDAWKELFGIKKFAGTDELGQIQALQNNFNKYLNVLRDVKSQPFQVEESLNALQQGYPEFVKGAKLAKGAIEEINKAQQRGNELFAIKNQIGQKQLDLDKQKKKLEAIGGDISPSTKQGLIDEIGRTVNELTVLQSKYDKLAGTGAKKSTEAFVDEGAAAKKAQLEKKIGEDLLKINFDIDEKRKLQNKHGFEKDLAELQINLDRQLKVLADFEKKTVDPKLRAQINAIKLKEQEDFEKAKLDLTVKYLYEAAKLRQEIEDSLLKGQQKEEAAALRDYEAFIDKINKLPDGKEKNGLKEQATLQHFERLRAIEDKYAIELINRNEKEDLAELDLMKIQFENIKDAQEQKFNQTKHGEAEITKFKAEQAKLQEIIALELAKKELEIKVNSAAARLGIGTAEEQAAAQAVFDNLQAQLSQKTSQLTNVRGAKTTTKDKKGEKNLFQLLGFSEDDSKEMQKNADRIISEIEKVEAARLKAADSAVQVAEKQVKAAETALDREIKLGEAGFASNVTLKQMELEQAKKNEAEALENKKKIARQNLIIDTAQQASSIGVSASNLIRTWSTLPFGVGLIAAGAQIAGLIAVIANVVERSKAINTGVFEKGGQGRVGKDGVIIGNRHSDGGVPLEVEGGEFFATDGKKFGVVNRKMTDKHWSLLDAINRDDKGAMFNYMSNMVELDRSLPDRLEANRNAKISVTNNISVRELQENNAILRQLLAEARKDKSGAVITDLGDRVRIQRGSKTTIMKK